MKRLDELCLRAMDADLDPAEAAELDRLIAAGPVAEARFLALMDIHHGLVALAAPVPDTAAVMQAVWRSEASGIRRTVRHRVRRGRRRQRSRPLVLALAAMGLVAMGLVAVLAVRGSGQPAPGSSLVDSPATASAAAIARALMDGGELLLGVEATVEAAAEIRVERLSDASAVGLRAGSRLRLIEALRWRLEQGEGAWAIAPQAAGRPFVVETPHARVVVLGTRFILKVEARWSELRMQHGRVRVEAPSGGVLGELADQAAARIHADGRFEVLDQQTVAGQLPPPLALWSFAGGSGSLVRDLGGAGCHLQIEDPDRVRWQPDGLRLLEPVRLIHPRPVAELSAAIRASGAFTVLLDLTPDPQPADFDVRRIGAARIFTISDGAYRRNLTIGQGEMGAPWSAVSVRLRHDRAGGRENGLPATIVPGVFTGQERIRLVVSYDAIGGLKIHQGTRLLHQNPAAGNLADWSEAFGLALGGELEIEEFRPWIGTYHQVAVFDRALDPRALATWQP